MFSEVFGSILQAVFAKNIPGYALCLDEYGNIMDDFDEDEED